MLIVCSEFPRRRSSPCAISTPGAFDRLYQRVPALNPDLPRFADYREMLDAVELDAVQVLTPHTLHYEHIMIPLERRLHVLTESPWSAPVSTLGR